MPRTDVHAPKTITLNAAIDGLASGSQASAEEINQTLAEIAHLFASRPTDEQAICDETTFGQVADQDGEPVDGTGAAGITDDNDTPLTNAQVAADLAANTD